MGVGGIEVQDGFSKDVWKNVARSTKTMTLRHSADKISAEA